MMTIWYETGKTILILDEEGRVAAPTLKPELHTAQFI
jgi:hypothetical protein